MKLQWQLRRFACTFQDAVFTRYGLGQEVTGFEQWTLIRLQVDLESSIARLEIKLRSSDLEIETAGNDLHGYNNQAVHVDGRIYPANGLWNNDADINVRLLKMKGTIKSGHNLCICSGLLAIVGLSDLEKSTQKDDIHYQFELQPHNGTSRLQLPLVISHGIVTRN